MLDFFDTLNWHERSVGRLRAPDVVTAGGRRGDRSRGRAVASADPFLRRRASATSNGDRSRLGGVDEHAMRLTVLATPASRPIRHIVVAVRDRARDPDLDAVDWDPAGPRARNLSVWTSSSPIRLWPAHGTGGFTGVARHRGCDSRRHDPAPAPRAGAVAIRRVAAHRTGSRGGGGRVCPMGSRERTGRRDGVARSRGAGRAPASAVRVSDANGPGFGRHPQPDVRCPAAGCRAVRGRARRAAVVCRANFAEVPAMACCAHPISSFTGTTRPASRSRHRAALDRELSGPAVGISTRDGCASWEPMVASKGARLAGHALSEAAGSGATRERGQSSNGCCVPPPDRPPTRSRRCCPGNCARAGSVRPASRACRRLRPLRRVGRRIRRGGGHDPPRGRSPYVRAAPRRLEFTSWTPSAQFGEFDRVQLAGLVDGEWPDRRDAIFSIRPPSRDLGWPADADRVDDARAAFADLLALPSLPAGSTFSRTGRHRRAVNARDTIPRRSIRDGGESDAARRSTPLTTPVSSVRGAEARTDSHCGATGPRPPVGQSRPVRVDPAGRATRPTRQPTG